MEKKTSKIIPKEKQKMTIVEKEPIFKIGDWVIICKEVVENINKECKNEALSQFESPQKVVKIVHYRMDVKHNWFVYHIGYEGNIIEIVNHFRLATEKEIKEQIIKNVFQK
jgi:hypothetical protein